VNRVVTSQEFLERIADAGITECECGSHAARAYAAGGEMEPLYLMSKNQVAAEMQAAIEGTGAFIAGHTVLGLSCADCGLVRLYNPNALGLG
jgi:hypothetical protein